MEVNMKILTKHIIEIILLPHVEVFHLLMTHMWRNKLSKDTY